MIRNFRAATDYLLTDYALTAPKNDGTLLDVGFLTEAIVEESNQHVASWDSGLQADGSHGAAEIERADGAKIFLALLIEDPANFDDLTHYAVTGWTWFIADTDGQTLGQGGYDIEGAADIVTIFENVHGWLSADLDANDLAA